MQSFPEKKRFFRVSGLHFPNNGLFLAVKEFPAQSAPILQMTSDVHQ